MMLGPYTKGPEIKVWFLVKVEDARQAEAEANLCRLACERQWNKDWRIRKIGRIHLGETRRQLAAFAPAADCAYDFFILVIARDRDTLVNQAFQEILKAVGHASKTTGPQPAAYILFCMLDMDT